MVENIQGLNVDADAMAKGLYAIITERGEAALVAFGMLPHAVIELFEKQLGEKYEASAKEQAFKLFGLEVDPVLEVADQAKKKAFVRDVSHAVCVKIYGVAADAGKMMV